MQPKRVTESRYAERDARDAAAAAASIAVDPTDAAAVKRAQEDAEMRMMAEQVGDSAAAPPPLADLAKQNEAAKSKADFEALAAAAFDALGEPHTKSKQYKTYVKALAKAFCDKLDKEGIKDVETALAGQRSEKVKAELAANAAVKKGVRRCYVLSACLRCLHSARNCVTGAAPFSARLAWALLLLSCSWTVATRSV